MSNEISQTGWFWWLSFLFLTVQAHYAARTQTGQRLLDAFAERVRGRRRDG